jgi:acyl carrier protein
MVEQRIQEFVVKTFPLARKKSLAASDKLLESGILDSLGVLDLVGFVEQEFGIHVSDEDLLPENFQTIDSLVTYIQRKSLGETSCR